MVILQLVVFLLIYGIKGSSTPSLSSSPNTVVTYTCTITNGTAAGLTDWTLPTGTCPGNAFPDRIRLSQFVSGQCSAQVTSTCGPYAAYSIQSSDPTYCLSFILNVTITAAMNGSTVTCYNTNYLNSSITGVVFSATINIVGPVPTPNSPSTPTAPPQNSTPVTPPTSDPSITKSTNGTNTLTTAATPPTSGPPITGSTNDTAVPSNDVGWIAGVIIGGIAFIITGLIVVTVIGIMVVSIKQRKWAPSLNKVELMELGEVPLVVVKKASESTEAAPQQITVFGRNTMPGAASYRGDGAPTDETGATVETPHTQMPFLTHEQVNSGMYDREHSNSEEKEARFLATTDLAVGKASQSNLVTGSN